MKRFFDKAWWFNKESISKYDRGLKLSSLYIEMRDGVIEEVALGKAEQQLKFSRENEMNQSRS